MVSPQPSAINYANIFVINFHLNGKPLRIMLRDVREVGAMHINGEIISDRCKMSGTGNWDNVILNL